MKVASLLTEVEIHLVSHKELMTPVAGTQRRGVELVTVAQLDAFDDATQLEGDRGGRTVGETRIKASLLMRVLQSPGDISTPSHPVSTSEDRGLYG